MLKVSAVSWGEFDERESKTCTDPERFDERLFVRPGDFLISRANTIELVGACVIVQGVTRRLMLSDKTLRLRLNGGIEPRWLLYALRAPSGRSEIERLATGNQLSMRNISQESLEAIRIPVAPRSERQRIVAELEKHLTRLDAACRNLEEAKRRATRYDQGLIDSAVNGGLIDDLSPNSSRSMVETFVAEVQRQQARCWPQRRSDPSRSATDDLDPPKHCAILPFANLLREPLRNGYSAKASKESIGVPTITLTAVTLGEFIPEHVKQTVADPDRVRELWLQPGDLLFERGNTPDLVGLCRLYQGESNFAIFPDLIIRARTVDAVNPAYIELVMQSSAVRRYFRKSAQGTAGSMPKIDQGVIERVPVPLPCRLEQDAIVERVKRKQEGAERLRQAIQINSDRARALRRSLLKQTFAGTLTHAIGPAAISGIMDPCAPR